MYPYHEIICNQRSISIEAILLSKEIGQTPFEHSLFQFIQQWMSSKDTFTLHTSGSTGAPKKIILSRAQFQQSAQRTIQALNLTSGSTAFICLDTKYIAGKMMAVRALEGHLKIIATEPVSNPLATEILFDFTAVVPIQLQEIIRTEKSRKILDQCKVVIVGGASVNSQIEKEVKQLSCAVYATYGMTETVSHIALQRLNGKESVDFFTTLPGIFIDTDERGCLVITLSKEKIITNDLVTILSPTTFRLLGRIDHVINSGGVKIFPEKIEKVIDQYLSKLGITRAFFTAGVPDERLGQKLILVIEGESLPKTVEGSLAHHLKETLDRYEVPRQIIYLPAFSRTETGKINRLQSLDAF